MWFPSYSAPICGDTRPRWYPHLPCFGTNAFREHQLWLSSPEMMMMMMMNIMMKVIFCCLVIALSILAWLILSKFINIRAVVFQKNYVLNNILFWIFKKIFHETNKKSCKVIVDQDWKNIVCDHNCGYSKTEKQSLPTK